MAWGRVGGGALSYVAALVSVSLGFAVVRAIGGQPLATIERPRVRALLARLDQRPILTVALLRLFLWVAPALNYALALSSVRYRDYAIGSALGLALPMALAAALFGVWFH
ncbi:MAG: VTT domain-containing protein, partial [Polyangia bacterium]